MLELRHLRRRRRARGTLAGLHLSRRPAADGRARRRCARLGPSRRHRGRHGNRQDVRLSAARAAARAARDHLDRHAHAAGPAVRPRPAAARRRGRPARCDVARAQGPQQLSVLAPARRRRCATVRATRRRVAALQALDAWGQTSDSGDLTELEDLAEDHALRAQVTSTVDNCLGRECEFFDRCFVLEARRRGAGRGRRDRQSSLAARRSRAEGCGFRRAAAGHRRRDRRRGASAARCRAAVFRLVRRARASSSRLLRDVFAEARVAGVLARVDAALSAVGSRGRRAARRRGAAATAERRGSRRPRRCATRCPTRPHALEALGAELEPLSGVERGLAQLLRALLGLRGAVARHHGRGSERGAALVRSHARARSRCTGRRSTSARRSPRASRRRAACGCSRPRRSRSARTSRIS